MCEGVWKGCVCGWECGGRGECEGVEGVCEVGCIWRGAPLLVIVHICTELSFVSISYYNTNVFVSWRFPNICL